MIAVILPLRASDRDDVARLAEEFSPRIECGASGVALDASGLSRLFGSAEGLRTAMSGAEGLARELARQAAARGLSVRVCVAATRTAATIAAHASMDHTVVIPSGLEREALAPLPLSSLASIEDLIGPALEKTAAAAQKRRRKGQVNNSIERLQRWGLETLGDLAGLPASELSARLGPAGLVLQRAASGQDERPLVPAVPPPSFLQSMRLEWPVDDLQPLAFIVSRLCESLEQALAAADRGAISLTTMLRLVTKEAYARTLALPSPMRDARVLRTLVMLDLESHPPGAAIDEVVIDVDVAPGRILQTGLFEPALPAPEALSTLVARLGAVAGESHVGAPALMDTHRPGAFEMKPFAPHQITKSPDHQITKFEPAVIRRFRPARIARVRVERHRPVRLDAEDISGTVVMAAGPWRTSGGWWRGGWDRDEWDVALETGVTCRVAHDRATGTWVVDGVLD